MNKIQELLTKSKVKIAENDEKINISKFMTKYFVFAGVWKSEKNHSFNSLIAMVNLTVLIMGFLSISYMFILKYNDIDINTEILLHTVEIFHTICVQILFIRKKNEIARLSEVFNITIDQMTPMNSIRCSTILEKEQKSLVRVMKISFISIIGVYVSVIYDSNAFGFRGTKKLLYPSWFPFETDVDNNTGFYYLAVVFEFLIYMELLFIDLAAVGLWYGSINAVGGILDILGTTFQLMSEEDEHDGELEFRIKTSVDLHNYAMDLVKTLNSSIGLIFLEVVLSSEIAICFSGFHVIQAIYTKEYTRLLKFFIGGGVFCLMLFVYCASGQKLKNKSDDFFKSLYFTKWYQQSKSFKRSFYLCQTVSTKPLIIDGAQVFPAELHTFVYAMKGVFSFLNFLLAIKNKS